ncbi:MAG: tetratricopeptide repeat protein [Lachnospiraceae bacterium]|nr:tetratricopeptide repeat protein [Lachnospiraceae bacterium]
MFCYECGRTLSKHDFCTACGADVRLYKKIIHVSNMYYNEGLEKAVVRDLTGAAESLRQSLKFNKSNIEARNLLGLVYFEMGEVMSALSQWVLSKNMQPEKNIADDYIDKVQSNVGRLASINQSIKKYNQALVYCHQDSKDLAVIQLKKVLSLNPRFVRAHQLLALLYIDGEEWERAERELRKCMKIDRNNAQTLRYLKVVEDMLTPEEPTRQSAKHKKDEAVRYRSENEIIIQPLNVKEPKRSGVSTLLNMGIGIIIGLAVTYFLLVPAAEQAVRTEDQDRITAISNEADAKTVRIQELEGQISGLNESMQGLRQQMEELEADEGPLPFYDKLLLAAASYVETKDVAAAAANLEEIAAEVQLEEMSEGFQTLYGRILGEVGPELASQFYNEGYSSFKAGRYDEAVELFTKVVYYDPEHVRGLYTLGRTYEESGDSENAILCFDKVIELFPGTEYAGYAQTRRGNLAAGN